MVTKQIVAMALNATEHHRNQIQGFCYPLANGNKLHVVRDLTRRPDEQRIWAEEAADSAYEGAHARMTLAIEQAEAAIIADRINRLMGETS